MAKLIRFGVAIDEDILRRFDAHIHKGRYTNRSEALRDLMRAEFVRSDWESSSKEVVGVITISYDHHQRGLVNKLLHIQHDHPATVLCAQHIHLKHDQCLEVIVARGEARRLKELADRMKKEKGVQFATLSAAGGAETKSTPHAHS